MHYLYDAEFMLHRNLTPQQAYDDALDKLLRFIEAGVSPLDDNTKFMEGDRAFYRYEEMHFQLEKDERF